MMHDIDQLNGMTAADLAALLSDDGSQTAILRAAAEGGAVDAQLLLGQRLLDQAGDADGANAKDAVLWFSRAATAGHPMGMNMLGRCLDHGWGTAVDKRQAAAWYEAAAGRRLAWGMYNLATLLTLGDGVPRDRARALHLFQRAAALGHAKSMNMVGSFHEDGWVVPVDLVAASLWYKRAAEGGDFRGQFNHARMLVSAGRIDAGIGWLQRLPRTAPTRFLEQVRAWLDASAVPALRALALDARPETRYASASQ